VTKAELHFCSSAKLPSVSRMSRFMVTSRSTVDRGIRRIWAICHPVGRLRRSAMIEPHGLATRAGETDSAATNDPAAPHFPRLDSGATTSSPSCRSDGSRRRPSRPTNPLSAARSSLLYRSVSASRYDEDPKQRVWTRHLERERGVIIRGVFHRDGEPIRDINAARRSACERAGLTKSARSPSAGMDEFLGSIRFGRSPSALPFERA
jgi:hypothetical protein